MRPATHRRGEHRRRRPSATTPSPECAPTACSPPSCDAAPQARSAHDAPDTDRSTSVPATVRIRSASNRNRIVLGPHPGGSTGGARRSAPPPRAASDADTTTASPTHPPDQRDPIGHVPAQPAMHRLASHAETDRDVRDRRGVVQHLEHCLIALFAVAVDSRSAGFGGHRVPHSRLIHWWRRRGRCGGIVFAGPASARSSCQRRSRGVGAGGCAATYQ